MVIAAVADGTTSLFFFIAPVTMSFPALEIPPVLVAMRELCNVGFSKFLMGLRTLSADKRFRVIILFVINSSAIALLVRVVIVGFKFIFTRRDFFAWIVLLGVIVFLGDDTVRMVPLVLF